MGTNTNAKLGKEVVARLGGQDNIKSMTHCSTRVRVILKDEDAISLDDIKQIPGVMGAVKSMGGVQVIVGNNVSKVYQEIQGEFHLEAGNDGGVSEANPLDKFLNMMSAVLGPVIPLVVASGLISALLVILKMAGMDTEGNTYHILSTAADAAFYFLPFFLAFTCAQRYKCSVVVSLFLAGVLLHPNTTAMMGAGEAVHFIGIPVTLANYTSSLIPIILTIWVYSFVEKLADKYIPEVIKYVFKPLVSVLVMLPITLCITGPAGTIVGNLLSSGLTALHQVAPWAVLVVISCLAPLMVLTGTHLAMLPLIFANFATFGYDNTMFVAFIGMNFSQFAVSLAVMLKTKNKNLKQMATGTALTAFLCGVTEPALYGICVRMKKPLIATWVGCIVNGIFCAVFSVKEYAFGAPGFFTMVNFIDPNGSNNFYYAIAAACITIAVTFVATWILGFDDSVYDEAV